MGGSVFKTNTKRLTLQEHNEIRNETIQLLYNYTHSSVSTTNLNRAITGIKSITSKKTFGDIDILINTNLVDIDSFLHDYRNQYLIKRNSDSSIISLLHFGSFQIDLILVKNEYFFPYYNYMNYNCVGNLMGKLAHGISLNYGLKGLLLAVKDGKNIVDNIIVTQDLEEICNYLDLDYSVYKQGFYSNQDIFKFIMSSKYYNRSLFDLENISSKNRNRNKKRPDYNEFLQYIKENDNSQYVHKIFNIYEALNILRNDPLVLDEYMNIKIKLEDKYKKSFLFNGDIVKKVTGLKGKELGIFMKEIKEKIDFSLPIETQILSLFNKV